MFRATCIQTLKCQTHLTLRHCGNVMVGCETRHETSGLGCKTSSVRRGLPSSLHTLLADLIYLFISVPDMHGLDWLYWNTFKSKYSLLEV